MNLRESQTEIQQRRLMVQNQLRHRGISDESVLQVMAKLGRQHFVAPEMRMQAYFDQPLPIGMGQTISQPYIVALMTEKLQLAKHHEVLEIGTGCGYQTAILAQLAKCVYTIELVEELAYRGRKNLVDLGIDNVKYHIGDGSLGWPERRQFDRILVAATARDIPRALQDQLADEGKMVIPVGKEDNQRLLLIEKQHDQIKESLLCYCRFVKLVQE